MVLKYTSSKALISKVFRDLRIQDTEWIVDGIEWIGEALDAIGSYAQTVTKSTIVQTSDHRIALLPGTISIKGVYYTKHEIPEGETPTREDFTYKLPYGAPDIHPAYVPEDEEHPVKVNRSKYDETFLLDAGFLRTSFESDWILITYQAVNVDNNGFPLVPDMYEFSQALYWYIVYKMMEGGRKHPAGLNYFQAEERWDMFAGRAKNRATMPDEAQAERFKDMWVGLLPNKAFEWEEHPSDEAVDAKNLVSDTFQRYTVDS